MEWAITYIFNERSAVEFTIHPKNVPDYYNDSFFVRPQKVCEWFIFQQFLIPSSHARFPSRLSSNRCLPKSLFANPWKILFISPESHFGFSLPNRCFSSQKVISLVYSALCDFSNFFFHQFGYFWYQQKKRFLRPQVVASDFLAPWKYKNFPKATPSIFEALSFWSPKRDADFKRSRLVYSKNWVVFNFLLRYCGLNNYSTSRPNSSSMIISYF